MSSVESSTSIFGTAVTVTTRLSLAVVLYFILKFLYQIVYYRFFHPLSKFPGPFWASVTRLYITYYNLKETEYTLVLDLHKKYGKFNHSNWQSNIV